MTCPARLALVVSATLAAAACAGPAVETDDVEVGADGKADLAGELRVRAGGTTLWVDRAVTPRLRDGRAEWILAGRTSRTLTDGMSFVFDDVVGDFAAIGPRRFEVAYPAGDRGLLAGVSHFVRLGLAPSATRPDGLTARVIVRPRFTGFTGAGAYLGLELDPIVVAGRVVGRVAGRTSSAIQTITARVGDRTLAAAALRVVDPTHFTLDLGDEEVTALVAGDELILDLELASGRRQKRGRLGLGLRRLGLTDGDPYEVWPPRGCADPVRACLDALAADQADTSGCGEAVEVLACGGTGALGVVFDDVAFAAASARAGAALADAGPGGFAADASALVGADRAAALGYAVAQTIEAGLEQRFGQRFADPAALDAEVDAVIARAIDQAYARPLELVEPHPAAPGDLAATRQVAADALLAYLAGADLSQTEFGRPLDELTRLFRTRHVADLRALRETVVPITDGAGRQVFVHRWLDPYVEVRVDPATGQVIDLLFEID